MKETSGRPRSGQKGGPGEVLDSQCGELEKWREKVHRQIGSGAPLLDQDFDSLFDDRFFGRKYDPFAEMERIHRQMRETTGDARETPTAGMDKAWADRKEAVRQIA